MQSSMKFGLSCALALPLNEDLNIDCERLKAHARRCLEAGCSSVTIFGTTGEGASISLAERRNVLETFSTSGADLRRQVFGGVTGTSVGDAVEQARVVIERDCCGLLLSPPFYFKDVDDEGLYRWFSQVFETIGCEARNVILYHIPSVTQIASLHQPDQPTQGVLSRLGQGRKGFRQRLGIHQKASARRSR